jgi:hypothetical protein
VALGDAAGVEAERRDRHDLAAVQGHQAVRGADELHRGPAVGELVLHDLRDRQAAKRVVERALQARPERSGPARRRR